MPPMMIVTTLEELRAARTILEEPVGFVPTMGFLHEGHLSLVRRAKEECASSELICSKRRPRR